MSDIETFNYSGMNVTIEKGKNMTKNELKSSLKAMNIDFDITNNSKAYLSEIYKIYLINI